MVTCVQCEDCKFANWDATLFRDHEEGRWEGGHYIPPYNEQFDVYCIKERRHFIGFELSKEYFDKAVRRIKAEQAQLTLF